MSGSFERFLAAVLLVVVASPSLIAEEPVPGIDPSLIIEQFDIYNDGDLLLVPVTVFGKTRMFAVDTGCSLTVYDKSLRPFLVEPLKTVEWTTPGGAAAAAELFDPPTTLLGKISLSADKPVACFDLHELNRVSGHRMAGLLGMPMLRDHVIHISSDASQLSILKRAPQDAGEEFKLSWWKGVPVLEAEIVGYGSECFQLDTGFARRDGCLVPHLMDELQGTALAELLDSDGRALDLSGIVDVSAFRVKELRLGRHCLRDLRMDTHATTRPERAPGVLGMRFLSRFNVTFDFPNSTLYLQKSKRFNHRELPDLGGLTFTNDDAGTLVDDVEDDSPAASAGIRVNDIVLKVGEHDASGARLFKLYEEFTVPGRTVHVRLLRDGEIVETDVKLPDDEKKDSVAGHDNSATAK